MKQKMKQTNKKKEKLTNEKKIKKNTLNED